MTPFAPTPGQHLYNAVMAGFRAKGATLHAWANQNGYTHSEVRAAAFGTMAGAKGRAVLERMISAAGPDVVSIAYANAIRGEAERLAS